MWSKLFVLAIAASLSACAAIKPSVVSRVTVFHQSPELRGKTFGFRPTESQKSSLEFKQYSDIISSHLKQVGMQATKGDPNFSVELTYGIGDGKEISNSVPIIGQTGVSSSTAIGNTVYHRPTYGIVGSQTYSSTEYMRTVTLKIYRLDNGSPDSLPVYEAKLTSSGSSSQVAAVFPEMMKALFTDFPGKNGSSVVRSTTAD